MRGITGDKLRGHIETAILSSLERGKSHGLEFVNRIEPVGSGALRRKEGFLCTALYRLEQARLVKGQWEGENTGRRGARRRIDQLTAKGRRRLVRDRQEWSDSVTVMSNALGALV